MTASAAYSRPGPCQNLTGPPRQREDPPGFTQGPRTAGRRSHSHSYSRSSSSIERRSYRGRRQGEEPCLLPSPAVGGRQHHSPTLAEEEPAVLSGPEGVHVIPEHSNQLRRNRHPADFLGGPVFQPAVIVALAGIGPLFADTGPGPRRSRRQSQRTPSDQCRRQDSGTEQNRLLRVAARSPRGRVVGDLPAVMYGVSQERTVSWKRDRRP